MWPEVELDDWTAAAAVVVPSVSLKHSDSQSAGSRVEAPPPAQKHKHSAVTYTTRACSFIRAFKP